MKIIEKIQWFALGMAATVIIIAAYCFMQNGSENSGNYDNVAYEDSAARCAVYGQVMVEYDTTATPLLTKEQVSQMFHMYLAKVVDSTRYDVDAVCDIFVRELHPWINNLIMELYTPDQLRLIKELYKDIDIERMSEVIMTRMSDIEKIFSNPELTRELESCRIDR